jgi:hypothetical protein
VKTGRRVQLDWSLDNVNFPSIGRKTFEHKIVDLAPHGFTALDDEIHMNTQSSSQWEKTNGDAPAPHARHEIRVDELDEVAKSQGVTLRQGDILMIRSGYVGWHK